MLRRTAATAFFAIEGFLDRLVCVLGAVCAAQAPEFLQQYLQRLGGALGFAHEQLRAFEAAAQAAGKPWARFVADTIANPDPGLAKLGTTMADTATRVDELATAQAALLDASVWSRPWAFLRHLETGIAHDTLAAYQPAVPTTAEGLVYAAAGLAVAFGLWHLLVRLPLRRLLGPRPAAAPVPVRAD
jgi:hypothetical protein